MKCLLPLLACLVPLALAASVPKAPPVWNGQCVVDSASRLFPYGPHRAKDRTPANCITLCREKNYKFAGVQYGNECFCGNTAPASKTSETECNRPCLGDSSQTCGGSWRMNVYSTGSGCSWDPEAPMFQQQEEEGKVLAWNYTLGPTQTVENSLGLPTYPWTPDGHISTAWDNSTREWLVFHPNFRSYRSRGPSPLPELQLSLAPSSPVLGGRIQADQYNNGGEWLMAVHPTSSYGLTGFVHVEDHFWQDGGFLGGGKAYKSISLVCSFDKGQTWMKKGQVLTAGEKPASPAWSGIGDFDTVWDWQEGRWFLVASHMRMAVSESGGAGKGTWRGWDGSQFSTNSSLWTSLRDVDGERLPNGEHPAIHWNRFLRCWVLVWNGYDGRIYISTASRLADRSFETPRVLVEKEYEEQINWYPTLISPDLGDRLGESYLHLYWREFPQGFSCSGRNCSVFRTATLQLATERP